jgi:hypothetical protein
MIRIFTFAAIILSCRHFIRLDSSGHRVILSS